MAYYQGSAGGIITTHHELLRLAENRKSVCIFNGVGMITTVLPASSLLHRPFGDVIKMLQSGTWHEYIKPIRPNLRSRFTKVKRLSMTEQRDVAIDIARRLLDAFTGMPMLDMNSAISANQWNKYAELHNKTIRELDFELNDLIINKQGKVKHESDQARRTENH